MNLISNTLLIIKTLLFLTKRPKIRPGYYAKSSRINKAKVFKKLFKTITFLN